MAKKPKVPKEMQVEIEPKIDLILDKIQAACRTIAPEIDKSNDHAIFVIGAKCIEDPELGMGVETFTYSTGFADIIAEGLFSEIQDQMTNGDMGLFLILRDVVRDLEEEFDINPEEDIETPYGNPNALH